MKKVEIEESKLFEFAVKNIKSLDKVKLAVESFGLDVNLRDIDQTLLYAAFKENSFEVFKYLIEECDACVNVGINFSHDATKLENLDCTTLLDIMQMEAKGKPSKKKFIAAMVEAGALNEEKIIETSGMKIKANSDRERRERIVSEVAQFLHVADHTTPVTNVHFIFTESDIKKIDSQTKFMQAEGIREILKTGLFASFSDSFDFTSSK